MMYRNEQIPFELQRMVEAELTSGEHIMWSAQPLPGRFILRMIPLVLFGLIWTAFTLVWTAAAGWAPFKAGNTGLFNAFSWFNMLFILIGLGMLSSPLWMLYKVKRTVYVLTDRRAIIMDRGWRGNIRVRSFEPEALTDLKRKQRVDGSGDLVFAQDVRHDGDGGRQYIEVGFLGVHDVKSVEQKVRALIAQKRTTG